MTDNYGGTANCKMRYMLLMSIMEGDPLARDAYRDWLMDVGFSGTGAEAAAGTWAFLADGASKQEIHGWLGHFEKQLKNLENVGCTGQSS